MNTQPPANSGNVKKCNETGALLFCIKMAAKLNPHITPNENKISYRAQRRAWLQVEGCSY